jgi:hypothetical protein
LVVVIREAARSAHDSVAVMLDMVFGRIVRMTGRELCVAVRNERLMRRVRVVALLIVLGCMAMMPRRGFMVVGRRKMMFLAGEHFRHGFSNAVM